MRKTGDWTQLVTQQAAKRRQEEEDDKKETKIEKIRAQSPENDEDRRERAENRPAATKERQEFCYLLLRDGSRLPQWHVPRFCGLFLNVREGVKVSLVDNIVKVHSRKTLQRWIFNRKETSAFEEAVHKAMRA